MTSDMSGRVEYVPEQWSIALSVDQDQINESAGLLSAWELAYSDSSWGSALDTHSISAIESTYALQLPKSAVLGKADPTSLHI